MNKREGWVCVCGGRKRNGKEKSKGDKRNERRESRKKKDNFVEITLKKLFEIGFQVVYGNPKLLAKNPYPFVYTFQVLKLQVSMITKSVYFFSKVF